jgi:hypothetical protein
MDGFADRLQRLEGVVHALQQQNIIVARRLRWWCRLACSLAVLTVFSLPLSLDARSDDQKGEDHKGVNHQLKSLLQRFLAIERKLEHVTSGISVEGHPEFVITGANLRIVNGLGSTETTNGTGNLIVGYNEPRADGATVQTGSHNIVGGQFNNFTSFGGLVVGSFNEISGVVASVSGGSTHIASGASSSISGGVGNRAEGIGSTVSAGQGNRSTGLFASISGGEANIATGEGSSISGGLFNTVSNHVASISGGIFNAASGEASSVSGGFGGRAAGELSSISAGFANTATGTASSVSGGESNTANGDQSSVSGGHNRTAPGDFDWVAGNLFQDE